ncbi:(p)ppGpp synthase/HD superfamily hydrolase [Bacillus mesophilus]|uniref:Bifunctional (P)ppGpp synthetase/guanosine-3',5'-bis(Diphosphate) 3'-pyrophosphohydrolase n=1 Tax=Bacillus mesophilus TaxID=1808955 RepID=A0A6M0Q876_9BACI|nr:HD domain-containing protein [Bacillus mesophilus]MBM7662084.1 (p)ppGpp synthase/HD superfamily hydrolase [Bacillus mesophilus]NEY72561.1 bifunctional (p)ppGpp synthetase/guanosine-3',5'-bis(diphosphate) 3'-pyrophosphohydrolase [Bacillus mesophilus]
MELVEQARFFAMDAHEGQTRKLSTEPYFVHPEAVAMILQDAGLSDEVIAAGYLHDTVEDTEVTISEIRERFGEQVAHIVAGNTEDKSKSWEERKQHTIDLVKTASFDIKCLIAADKLDNLRSMLKENEHSAQDIWSHFKRGKKQQAWYYTNVASSLFENVEEEKVPDFFRQFDKLVQDFFK